MTLTVPGLGTLLRALYPMYITDSLGIEMMYCDIVELRHNESYEIPRSPVDSNSYISDNIYKDPYTLNLKVFCTENEFPDFEDQIKRFQKGGGFIVKGLSRFYKNLRLINRGEAELASMGSGYYVEMNFQEVIKVKVKKSKMTKDVTSPENAATENTGNASNNVTILKALTG